MRWLFSLLPFHWSVKTLDGFMIQAFCFAGLLGFEVVSVGATASVGELDALFVLSVVVKSTEGGRARPGIHWLVTGAL